MRNLLHRAQNLYRFHNPRKKKGVKRIGDNAQDEYMRWTITETDNGRSFLFTKFSVIDFFLTDKRNFFMYTPEIGLWQIFQLSIFVLNHEKYHYPGRGPNFRFFFSYFVLLPLLRNFEWHCLLEIRIFLCFFFSSHNSRKFQHTTLDWERSTLCHSFINLTQLIVKLNTCKKLS